MNRNALFITLLIAGIFSAIAMNARADQPIRQNAPNPQMLLFSGPGLSGRSVVIIADQPKLDALRFTDLAQSMQINAGRWEVCNTKRFRERCEIFGPGRYNLNDFGWGSDIASVRRVGSDVDTITLFSQPSFGGQARIFARKMDKLKLYGFNDHAASVRVNGGAWKICANSNLRGKCETIHNDIADLYDLGLSHQISSVGPANRSANNQNYVNNNRSLDRRQISRGFEGHHTVFFAAPTYKGTAIAACLSSGRQCDGQAATTFCQIAGLQHAIHYDSARTHHPIWYLGTNRSSSRHRQPTRLTDVLCAR